MTMRNATWLITLLGIGIVMPLRAEYAAVEWPELMPEEDLKTLETMPEMSHDGNNPVELPESIRAGRVVPAFDGRRIRLSGFVVPLEFDDTKLVTEFFLVPYFGACIHVPPPPPNQLIHVTYPEGIQVEVLYDPYQIKGTLRVERVSNDIGEASYTMKADTVAPHPQ